MFGEEVDYHLLKPLTHARNRATEDELNNRAKDSAIDLNHARRRIEKLQSRLDNLLPIAPKIRYLDVGCGNGDLGIALVSLGATDVTGVDVVARNIVAANANAQRLGFSDSAQFICADVLSWDCVADFDVVISHEALEHIEDPRRFLKRLVTLTRPDGCVVLAFGPLFHSPLGDHLGDFFRVPLPWRSLIFSEKALLRLRREKFRPTDQAATLKEITGHLNMMRYSEFERYVEETGWRFDYLAINPQLRTYPPLQALSNIVTKLPFRDYFSASVYAVLRKAGDVSPLSHGT